MYFRFAGRFAERKSIFDKNIAAEKNVFMSDN
jgi:hypothetical protein